MRRMTYVDANVAHKTFSLHKLIVLRDNSSKRYMYVYAIISNIRGGFENWEPFSRSRESSPSLCSSVDAAPQSDDINEGFAHTFRQDCSPGGNTIPANASYHTVTNVTL